MPPAVIQNTNIKFEQNSVSHAGKAQRDTSSLITVN